MSKIAGPLLIAAFLVSLPHASHTHAQEAGAAVAQPQSPRKIDEFGDIQVSDLKARLDNFAIALQNEPAARGYMMVYRSRRDLPGLNSRLLKVMKGYLSDTRALNAERLVAVDGGEASCMTQELWLVPEGATPPSRDDAYRRDFVPTEYARKFDEYHYFLPVAEGFYDASDIGDSLEAFAAALLKEPRTLAYVIAYPHYFVHRWEESSGEDETRSVTRTSINLDPPGAASTMLSEVSADLVKKYRIPRSRIRLVNGGHRRTRQVELWLVPRGEHAPVPTPNAFPKRRRR